MNAVDRAHRVAMAGLTDSELRGFRGVEVSEVPGHGIITIRLYVARARGPRAPATQVFLDADDVREGLAALGAKHASCQRPQ